MIISSVCSCYEIQYLIVNCEMIIFVVCRELYDIGNEYSFLFFQKLMMMFAKMMFVIS